MYEVADYYRTGTGLPQSKKNAKYWQQKAIATEERVVAERTLKAARAGDPVMMRSMSRFYTDGRGVAKDLTKAAYWDDKADKVIAQDALKRAEEGYYGAMYEVAQYYENGKGFAKDQKKAYAWKQKAKETEYAQTKRQQAKRERTEARRDLNEIDFFKYTKGTWDMWMSDTPGVSAGAEAISSSSGPFMTTFGVLMDLSSAPINSTQLILLNNKIAARPATFGKPDSMVAQASIR